MSKTIAAIGKIGPAFGGAELTSRLDGTRLMGVAHVIDAPVFTPAKPIPTLSYPSYRAAFAGVRYVA